MNAPGPSWSHGVAVVGDSDLDGRPGFKLAMQEVGNGAAVALRVVGGFSQFATIAVRHAIATPIQAVRGALPITFDWPLPVIVQVSPHPAVADDTVTLQGSGFLLASVVTIDDVDVECEVQDDISVTATCPSVSGDMKVTISAPGGAKMRPHRRRIRAATNSAVQLRGTGEGTERRRPRFRQMRTQRSKP